jgi:hypothetical protein
MIVVVIALAGCVRRVVSVEDVQKMINNQVPTGSDKQQVKAFIDSLKIDSLKIWRGDFGKADKNFLNHNDIFIEFALDNPISFPPS